MTTEVENIILNKEYFELTPEELESVNELVQNAEEFDEMKWFLASTQDVLVSEKIEATPELKQKVMTHLNQDETKRRFWLNGVGVALWPTDKEVYRRPAFQMSIAALLLIGFLFVYNRDIGSEQQMADNLEETIDDSEGKLVVTDETVEVSEDSNKDFTAVSEVDEEIAEDGDVLGGTLSGLEGPFDDQNGGGEGEVVSEEKTVLSEQPVTSMDVTDADGYYEVDMEPLEDVNEEVEVDELSSNSVNNANNNERSPKIQFVS